MQRFHRLFTGIFITMYLMLGWNNGQSQNLPLKYATLELFTNTPCPICGSQNPGFFSRLNAYEGKYHLISFYPGTPYSSCIFYQANVAENLARKNYYQIVGTPTVAINGTQFKNSGQVTNTVLDAVTGGESWLEVHVDETTGNTRTVNINLKDHVGGSISTGRLFAVIVEKEIMYTAPNGETIHRNVFRKFLTDVSGEDVDMSSGSASKTYTYTLDPGWQADQVYIIAWLINPATKEIYNSGTRFDPDMTSATSDVTQNKSLLIYPNPASSEITITLPEGLHETPVRIFDANGQVVYDEMTSGNKQFRINTGALSAGSYHVEIGLAQNRMRGNFEVIK